MQPINYSMAEIAKNLENRTINKMDAIIAITGSRGLGKSTFAYKLAHKTKLRFDPRKDILYSINEVLDWYSKNTHSILIFDEAIAMHNRDFFNKMQKKLIKILNMFRDSHNVLLLCVPFFDNLDKQLRQLSFMRIHLIERGMVAILLQKSGLYIADGWETKYNEAIEQYFATRKKKMNYSKLTTFVGFVEFGDLDPRSKVLYESIKKEKRNVVFEEETSNGENDPVKNVVNLMEEGSVTKESFVTIARSLGVKPEAFRRRVGRELEMRGKPTRLNPYFKKITNNEPPLLINQTKEGEIVNK